MHKPSVNQIVTKALELSILAETGAAVTLATGFLTVGNGYLRGALICGYSLTYGFPIPWRTIWGGCGSGVSLNGLVFLLDVLFYMAIGYAIILAYDDGFRGWTMNSPITLMLAAYVVFALTVPLMAYFDWALPAFRWIPILVLVLAEDAIVVMLVFERQRSKHELERTHPNH